MTHGVHTIRVLLADDHMLVREGLRQLLGGTADIRVEGEAANGDEALALVKANDYDLAVLDMSMPGLSGIELIKRLRLEKPRLRLLVLSMHAERQYAVRLSADFEQACSKCGLQIVTDVSGVLRKRTCGA